VKRQKHGLPYVGVEYVQRLRLIASYIKWRETAKTRVQKGGRGESCGLLAFQVRVNPALPVFEPGRL